MTSVLALTALDLFAGTGWGVACKRLGIKEMGVEIMPEAIATREANGMETIYRDVWDGLQLTAEQHREQYGSYGLLIASPPCQTFSMAGNGAGRVALNEVLEAIELHTYKDAEALWDFGQKHDPRTALVLAPLAYVWRDRPRLVIFEQVPTVLPVWKTCASVMEDMGYSVEVAALHSEQYGVPQTRKRAILIARLDGPVSFPAPTHSRYYPRTPEKLDVGVQKWVSMAEALGWGMTNRPYLTVAAAAATPDNKHTGGTDTSMTGGTGARAAMQREVDKGAWTPNPLPGSNPTKSKLAVAEAGMIQSYPSDFEWVGNKSRKVLQIANAVPPVLAEAILKAVVK